MKIKVKIGKRREKKHVIRRINLVFPNALLKSRLAVKIIRSGIESENAKGKSVAIAPDFITHDLLKTCYKCLKQVIKEQGHFNLVEVSSCDGTEVIIRI